MPAAPYGIPQSCKSAPRELAESAADSTSESPTAPDIARTRGDIEDLYWRSRSNTKMGNIPRRMALALRASLALRLVGVATTPAFSGGLHLDFVVC